MASSVARAVSGSAASAGHTFCASSMTRATRAHELVQQRLALRSGPYAKAIDPEVACPQLQVLGRRLGQVLQTADRVVLEQSQQLCVLHTVHDRIQAQQAGLLDGAEIAEADPYGVHAAGAASDVYRCRSVAVALVVSARLAEAHIVRVGVEHDDPQVGFHQQALEQHAEGVSLARARLATQEGVAAEAAGIEAERHAV